MMSVGLVAYLVLLPFKRGIGFAPLVIGEDMARQPDPNVLIACVNHRQDTRSLDRRCKDRRQTNHLVSAYWRTATRAEPTVVSVIEITYCTRHYHT